MNPIVLEKYSIKFCISSNLWCYVMWCHRFPILAIDNSFVCLKVAWNHLLLSTICAQVICSNVVSNVSTIFMLLKWQCHWHQKWKGYKISMYVDIWIKNKYKKWTKLFSWETVSAWKACYSSPSGSLGSHTLSLWLPDFQCKTWISATSSIFWINVTARKSHPLLLQEHHIENI